MFLLARKIKAMGIKMVMSGEGADETLAGYLYFHKAPNATELHDELVRKIDALHSYDCLRANKATMAHGLEVRRRHTGDIPAIVALASTLVCQSAAHGSLPNAYGLIYVLSALLFHLSPFPPVCAGARAVSRRRPARRYHVDRPGVQDDQEGPQGRRSVPREVAVAQGL
eukprot:6180001-Pleurochrysis_carterae.AAC.4